MPNKQQNQIKHCQLWIKFMIILWHIKITRTIQSYVYEKTTKPVYLSNLLKEISESCGYRPGHSNLTVAILIRDSKDDILEKIRIFIEAIVKDSYRSLGLKLIL